MFNPLFFRFSCASRVWKRINRVNSTKISDISSLISQTLHFPVFIYFLFRILVRFCKLYSIAINTSIGSHSKKYKKSSPSDWTYEIPIFNCHSTWNLLVAWQIGFFLFCLILAFFRILNVFCFQRLHEVNL